MKICEVHTRTPEQIQALVQLWENSVLPSLSVPEMTEFSPSKVRVASPCVKPQK